MDRHTLRQHLRAARPVIAPSMLRCDFGDLAGEVSKLEQAGAALLHWDVMDGHFVPNLSYGAMVFAPLRERTELFSEAHLMMSQPEQYLDTFLPVCDSIVVHIEAVPDPTSILRRVHDAGKLFGLALNPGTSVDTVEPWLDHCDEVLVMSVEPGFGGQSFMSGVLSKVETLRERLDETQLISIDGGIGPETIARASAAGCDLFVVGSAIFDQDDYADVMQSLTETARDARTS